MKKVFLIKNIKYDQLIIPSVDGENVCFKSKKECQKYIDIRVEHGTEDWRYCSPIAIRVYPRDNIAGTHMYIDKIDYVIDYDTNITYHHIQWSRVVYNNKDILIDRSSLYDYLYFHIYQYGLSDEYVNENNNHIYNRFTETIFDSMTGYVDYRIYKLKIV